MQARRLKQNWDAIETNDSVNLPAIKRDNVVAVLMFDIRAGHKRNPFAESLPRPVQHFFFFCIAQVIDVARVHVDGVRQPGPMGAGEQFRKNVDGNSAVWLVRQQSGGHALHFAARFLALQQILNGHL